MSDDSIEFEFAFAGTSVESFPHQMFYSRQSADIAWDEMGFLAVDSRPKRPIEASRVVTDESGAPPAKFEGEYRGDDVFRRRFKARP